MSTLHFFKGHGTENDFVIVADVDGELELTADLVAALCDRRAGIGGDGLLRVVRSAKDPAAEHLAGEAEWFMDYRNGDGSIAEMCGNGVRVFARHLVERGLAAAGGMRIATRGGIKVVTVPVEPDGAITVDMGVARLPGSAGIGVDVAGRVRPATNVDMGNPHAVVFVDDLADAGSLYTAPTVSPEGAYPDGVNVEFVVRRAPGHVAMRVHERGSGETRSCGTGACAVMVAVARADGVEPGVSGEPATYTVDVPGGTLTITERVDGHIEMTGPAVIVAEGDVDLDRLRDRR
ncbi:diaminopimelate epimerase [Streptomyces sp. SID3343]|uniref:diaminopimelate epimerase n=1 Tax=Streptomyces sp. SID3343 TaxID=2690260 RepID=UPI00136E30D7|nr:diaminopimelate epimerase [Streptomyces sp. SID3343]